MANVKIDITVDTAKLLAGFPNGGEITDHTIIVMTDNQPDSIYQTEFKDKLITRSPDGVKVKWKIKSLNNNDNLDLVDYLGDDQTLNVFVQKPKVSGSDKTECDADLKSNMSKTISTEYCISFCLKKNPSVVWNWDPIYSMPYPPK